MRAQAKDARGQGTAAATITSTMSEVQDGTRVQVETDMRVTGPAAQFGRGVMQDVSAKLMKRFAECLAEQLSGDGRARPRRPPRGGAAGGRRGGRAGARGGARAPRAASRPPSSRAGRAERVVRGVDRDAKPAPSKPAGQAEDVLDLGEASRDAVLKRAIPVVAAVGALLILLRILRR